MLGIARTSFYAQIIYLGFVALMLPPGPQASAQMLVSADDGMPDALRKALVSGGAAELAQPDGGATSKLGAIDGQSLHLADGRVLRLASIVAPLRPLGVADPQPWPSADTARAGLQSILASSGAKLRLHYDKERSNRHGQIVAHAETAARHGSKNGGGIWLQRALLRAGWARVRTTPRNFAGAAQLYAAEDVARRSARGLWADGYYRVRCAAYHRDIGEGFQVVVGRVVDVASVRNITYINFGASWRADFTIRIKGGARRKVGLENPPEHLVGELIEVRGVVFQENGPMIDLDHRAALRLPDDLPDEIAEDRRRVRKTGCPVGAGHPDSG